mmetsp:Transcript_86701/g.280152  ORF Transcript_86701/g.280152 Transcript_86701/m.280152 type:complete len:241 (-) Transcript_86701:113-835(-)
MLPPTTGNEAGLVDACHFDPRDARLGLKQSPHPALATQGLPSPLAEVRMLDFHGLAEPVTLQVAFVGLLQRTQSAREQRLPEKLGQFLCMTCARRPRRHRQRKGAALPPRPLRLRGSPGRRGALPLRAAAFSSIHRNSCEHRGLRAGEGPIDVGLARNDHRGNRSLLRQELLQPALPRLRRRLAAADAAARAAEQRGDLLGAALAEDLAERLALEEAVGALGEGVDRGAHQGPGKLRRAL